MKTSFLAILLPVALLAIRRPLEQYSTFFLKLPATGT
jgi:hypothetical protein